MDFTIITDSLFNPFTKKNKTKKTNKYTRKIIPNIAKQRNIHEMCTTGLNFGIYFMPVCHILVLHLVSLTSK